MLAASPRRQPGDGASSRGYTAEVRVRVTVTEHLLELTAEETRVWLEEG